MRRRCGRCGHRNEGEARFCGGCGAPLQRRCHSVLVALIVVASVALLGLIALWTICLVSFGGKMGHEPSNAGTAETVTVDGDFVQLGPGLTEARVTDKDDALAVISELGSFLGIDDATTQLADPDIRQGLDNTYYRFEQCYEGVPVYGRAVVVGNGPDGDVLGVTGNYRPLEGLGVNAAVSSEDAAKAACEGVRDGAALSCELCVYAPDEVMPVLAWSCKVVSPAALEQVFVDAGTGAVIERESLTTSAGTTISARNTEGKSVSLNVEDSGGGAYILKDNERNIWGYDANGEQVAQEIAGGTDEHGASYDIAKRENLLYFATKSGEILSNESCSDGRHYRLRDRAGKVVAEHARPNLLSFTADDQVLAPLEGDAAFFSSAEVARAVTLQGYLADATDFYQTLFDRDGFDGEAGRLLVVSDTRLFNSKGEENSRNAETYEDVGWALIKYGRKLEVSYDVAVHELSHALEGTISGMLGKGESGALKEAISDLVAMAAEDYAAGGRFDGAGCDWAVLDMRNLADPLKGIGGKTSGPREYRGEQWDSLNDVHFNSLVISHAGYLMCMGDGLDGDALSTDLMAQLVYLTLFSLPSDCTFSQFRAAMENAAGSMVMAGRLTERQVDRVRAAFDEVNVRGPMQLTGVSLDATLRVLDCNNAAYGAYTATVGEFSIETLELGLTMGPEMWDLAPQGAEPLKLGFPEEGAYRIEVRDATNPSHVELLYVYASRIISDRNEIILHTKFNEGSADADQTKRAQDLPDQRAHDIALVLDASNSMSGEPMEQMKNAAQEFIESTLGGSTRVGLVAYDDAAEVLQGMTSNAVDLIDAVDGLSSGGNTNIEDGLAKAERLLSPGVGARKIIVLMSDGAPNEGKTGDELIAYAAALKQAGCKIYTVGFNEGAEGYALLYTIASEGCHYEIEGAEDLSDFFADIASEIGGTRFVYVRVACPVDVEVSFEGETLSSAEESLSRRTSFGTLTFEDEVDADGVVVEKDGIKVMRLKEGPAYDVELLGTGEGEMDYSIGFADDAGDYTDFRTFEGVNVTASTIARTSAEITDSTRLEVDEDGDGVLDCAYEAGSNERARLADSRPTVYLTTAGCVAVMAAFGVALRGITRRRIGRSVQTQQRMRDMNEI